MHMNHIRYIDSRHTLGQPDVELPNPTQKIIIGSTSALSCLRHKAGCAEDAHSVSFFPCVSFCSTCSRVLCHTCCLLFGISTSRWTSALHFLYLLHIWGDWWGDPNRRSFHWWPHWIFLWFNDELLCPSSSGFFVSILCLYEHPSFFMSKDDWILEQV